jgi:NADH-quinone oxidoreductase subunit H
MFEIADGFVRSHGIDPVFRQAVYAAFIFIAVFAVVNFAAIFAGIISWAERRIAGRMMSRIGPNRVGPGGFLQWLADGIKCILKEDLIPTDADPKLFRIAPYFVAVGMFASFTALPFGPGFVAADMDVGIFYILSVTALVVVGIIMSGWASNSKWSLLGGMRSAAQIVSYEIPVALAILSPILLAGTLSTQGLIRAQGGWPWEWFVFNNPFCFVAFFIYFIAALAEGNRTPFDLPEAESELVAGYNTEYSGMRFALFFLAEWANLWVMSAIATVVFLGGWQVPNLPGVSLLPIGSLGHTFLGTGIFVLKTMALIFVVIQLRWTLPRIRVDQMMALCWKYLVPMSFACVLGTSLWMLATWGDSTVARLVRGAMQLGLTATGLALTAALFWRAWWNIKRAHGMEASWRLFFKVFGKGV